MDKLKLILRILRYILWTIYFNFKYLPFSQALKLPIILYKPHLKNSRGTYTIMGPVKFGMIQLGFPNVSIYPNTGIVLENRGKIIFSGKCKIGNNSALSLGEKGILTFGDNFVSSCGLKIVCYNSVSIGDNVLIGWNGMILDTDFHSLKSVKSSMKTLGYGSIKIGNNIWIAAFVKIYKNTSIPDFCIVAANTICRSKVEASPYSLIYTPNTIETKVIDMYRDFNDDKIIYGGTLD